MRLYGSDLWRYGVTTLLLLIGIVCAWTAIAVIAAGLCVLAARGDRTLRASAGEPANRSSGLRLIA
jgi:hypothetical protein